MKSSSMINITDTLHTAEIKDMGNIRSFEGGRGDAAGEIQDTDGADVLYAAVSERGMLWSRQTRFPFPKSYLIPLSSESLR